MKSRRLTATLTTGLMALSVAATMSATMSPASAIEQANPASKGYTASIVTDLNVTTARIDDWLAANPDKGSPSQKWIMHRAQHTGDVAVMPFALTKDGYCLQGFAAQGHIADHGYFAGTGLDGAVEATFDEIAATDSVCGSAVNEYRKAAVAASVKSDLKNLAVSFEVWMVEHPASQREFSDRDIARFVEQGWFEANPGTTFNVWGSATDGYCLRGTNPDLELAPGQGLWYDSAGGLRAGYDQPTGKRSVCAKVDLSTEPTPEAPAKPILNGPRKPGTTQVNARMGDSATTSAITAAEVKAFMVADLDVNAARVETYIARHGKVPSKAWMQSRTQHTGLSVVSYNRAGDDYCLSISNRYAPKGAKPLAACGSVA